METVVARGRSANGRPWPRYGATDGARVVVAQRFALNPDHRDCEQGESAGASVRFQPLGYCFHVLKRTATIAMEDVGFVRQM